MTEKQIPTLLLFRNEIWVNLSEYVHSKNNCGKWHLNALGVIT